MMSSRGLMKYRNVFVGLSLVILGACDPIPSKVLTTTQKEADMKWMFSVFDENYAPLEYKAKRYGFNYEELKTKYLNLATATGTNDEFYHVMKRFVAEFKDAHTSASLSDGGYPNRSKIAYLGFSGKRNGDTFVVTEVLPTLKKAGSHFPIHEGDEITELDGKPLTQWINENSINLENLGQPNSNLTFHMNRLFTRVSLSQELPKEPSAILTVKKRGLMDLLVKRLRDEVGDQFDIALPGQEDNVKRVTVPWIVKDSYDFKKEQKEASKGKPSMEAEDSDEEASDSAYFAIKDPGDGALSFFGFRNFDGSFPNSAWFSRQFFQRSRSAFLDSFYMPNQIEGWTSEVSVDERGRPVAAVQTPLEKFKKLRSIPKDVRWITSDQAIFPTYVAQENDGEEERLVATMYLDTFSPKGKSEDVIKEFKDTLEHLAFYGVGDLVIDLVNNGGGSLELGMKLAQALSAEKIEMPGIQFRTSQSWINQFESESLEAPSDAERELARRVYTQLTEEHKKGVKLSTPVNADILVPFELQPNEDLEGKFNIVLMVNEMCASMCDIFAAILQDNHMARVVGSTTMGAGGNVVTHYEAPNSHLALRQTESLIIRRVMKKGKVELAQYIENNGVQPDVEVNVSETTEGRYSRLRTKAVEALFPPKKKARRRK
jgi:C-terminal processing protease CtpA/Prc